MRDREMTPVERIPREYLYSAIAAMDNLGIYKNRRGTNSKLQSALGRLKSHLEEDDIVLVIKARDLPQPQRAEYKVPSPTFNQEYMSQWAENSDHAVRVDDQGNFVIEKAKSPSDEYFTARKANPFGKIYAKNYIDSIKR